MLPKRTITIKGRTIIAKFIHYHFSLSKNEFDIYF